MKKYALILMLIGILFSQLLSQTTINVPNGYSTIQQAVDYVFTLSGPISVTIQVEDGEYDAFKINNLPHAQITDLTVESINGNTNCIIDGNLHGSAVIINNSGNVIVRGFTIENASQLGNDDGHGVSIEDCNNVSVDYCHVRNNISHSNGGGVYVHSSSNITISNCYIYDNVAETYGGGIYYGSSKGSILTNHIYLNTAVYDGGGIHCNSKDGYVPNYSVEIKSNEIYENSSNRGGGIGIANRGRYYLIEANEIWGNTVETLITPTYTWFASGGGIRMDGNTDILNNTIYDNSSEVWGGGIVCREGVSVNHPYKPILSKNTIANNTSLKGGGIAIDQGRVIIDNCVIFNNSASEVGGGVDLDNDVEPAIAIRPFFNNCIIWNNTASQDQNQINSSTEYVELLELSYSCIEGGRNGVSGNTEDLILNNVTGANPLFEDPGNGVYHLTDASPCVDTGDPTYPADPDGTTIEMGCYYYPHPDYDIHRLSKGYNWESFPRIGIIEDNNNDETNIVPILEDIDPFGDIDNIIFDADGIYDLTYSSASSWNYDPYLAQSSWLYKIQTLPGEERILTVAGERLPADPADFTLEDEDPLEGGTKHWLGFWMPRNQKMIESFNDEDDGFWQYVDKVYSEDWYYSPAINPRGGDPTYPCAISAENLILESGKGYMVLFKEGILPITNFHWTPSDAAEEPKKKTESESFIYTEKADYEAIDVFNIPPNVTEIGVFEDDVCVGAITVEDTCAQILVYSDNANRDPIPFTFEVVTGRGSSTPVMDYQVLNLQTGKYETKSIFSGRQEYSIIRFGDEDEPEDNTLSTPQLHGNYPNPFNPTTTISFSLPDEQEIELSIYNIKGQKVKQLINGQLTAGNHTMIWDGKDTNGKSVGTGIYFYKLKTGKKEISRKMLLLK